MISVTDTHSLWASPIANLIKIHSDGNRTSPKDLRTLIYWWWRLRPWSLINSCLHLWGEDPQTQINNGYWDPNLPIWSIHLHCYLSIFCKMGKYKVDGYHELFLVPFSGRYSSITCNTLDLWGLLLLGVDFMWKICNCQSDKFSLIWDHSHIGNIT
jgi:hypothetical protein